MTLPPELVREAAVYRAAVLDGVVRPEVVVAWADQWLLKLEVAPEALIDVSYSRGDLSILAAALKDLSAGRADWSGSLCTLYLRLLAQWYQRHPQETRTVTQALHRLGQDEAVPQAAVQAASSFDDELDLALAGHYGTVEDVERRLREFLDRFTA